ncbi:hypothetical protein [Amycolatopsis sp. NBC_01480]|uniref:hypothetical protein n=1 Tax=Amycolatopsis sp. NBC_01480 TaxID=2903562 RepID=UPI002E2CB006|nr:hypothetical protein [Amycolatopsis sp. NBC_01480]
MADPSQNSSPGPTGSTPPSWSNPLSDSPAPAAPKANPIPNFPSIPYPSDSDKKIREVAEKVNHPDVIQMLDNIKNNLFGNAEKIELIAQGWASNTSMVDSRTEIQHATEKLSGYWSGPAYNQYSAYAADVTGAFDTDQSAIAAMGTTLGNCVSIVYNTYAAIVRFIGNTAADLVNAAANVLITLIPGVGELEASNALQATIDILTGFIRNCTDLLSSAVEQFGQYKGTAIGFTASAAGFKQLTPLPDQIGNPGSWHVNPAG